MGNSNSKDGAMSKGANTSCEQGLNQDSSLPNNFEFFIFTSPEIHFKVGFKDDYWYTIGLITDYKARFSESNDFGAIYNVQLYTNEKFGFRQSVGEEDGFFTFSLPSPNGPQTFSWRRAHRADGKKFKAEHSTSYGYKLVREGGPNSGEIVALWMWMSLSGSFGSSAGWFEFEGSARNGALGQTFSILTLMSLSKMIVVYLAKQIKLGMYQGAAVAFTSAVVT